MLKNCQAISHSRKYHWQLICQDKGKVSVNPIGIRRVNACHDSPAGVDQQNDLLRDEQRDDQDVMALDRSSIKPEPYKCHRRHHQKSESDNELIRADGMSKGMDRRGEHGRRPEEQQRAPEIVQAERVPCDVFCEHSFIALPRSPSAPAPRRQAPSRRWRQAAWG